jgi:hypothetical protein
LADKTRTFELNTKLNFEVPRRFRNTLIVHAVPPADLPRAKLAVMSATLALSKTLYFPIQESVVVVATVGLLVYHRRVLWKDAVS